MLRQGADDLEIIGVTAVPAAYGAAGQAEFRVGDNAPSADDYMTAKDYAEFCAAEG